MATLKKMEKICGKSKWTENNVNYMQMVELSWLIESLCVKVSAQMNSDSINETGPYPERWRSGWRLRLEEERKLFLLPPPFPFICTFETRSSLGNWGSGVLIGPLSCFWVETGGCGVSVQNRHRLVSWSLHDFGRMCWRACCCGSANWWRCLEV